MEDKNWFEINCECGSSFMVNEDHEGAVDCPNCGKKLLAAEAFKNFQEGWIRTSTFINLEGATIQPLVRLP